MLDRVRERKTFTFCLAALLMASSLSACGLISHDGSSSEKSGLFTFGDNGEREANLAVIAYTQGDFAKADDHVVEALRDNKKNAQALLVGALLSEKTKRPNRARQFYEEILLYNGNEVSVLGSTTPEPQKITDIARKRLRQLNLSQNKLIIEDNQGNKVFNISNEASVKNGTAAITQALSTQQKRTGQKTAATKVNNNEIGTLFSDDEKNTITRFMIFKDLAENDLITKEEFLRGRQANIGGLLPLTHAPASTQVIKPVPSADIIIDRINVLKSAVEDREITGKEFAAERNLIIEAVLPPKPVQRLKKKAPSKNIIDAAKDLRKLEVLYDLNLITGGEKEKETEVIEHALGLKETTDEQYMITPTSVAVQPQPAISVAQPAITEPAVVEIIEKPTMPQMPAVAPIETTPANKPTAESKPLLPDVSSPFK